MKVNDPYLAEGDGSSKASRNSIVLSSLFAMVRQQKKKRSPAYFARLLWLALINLYRCREILAALSHPELIEFARKNPHFPFKYIARTGYLARSLSVGQRISCFAHHYRRLRVLLPRPFLSLILNRNVTLAAWSEDSTRYTITLGYSFHFDHEGDLSLHVETDGNLIFTLSFSIIPGRAVGSTAKDVLLITRMQGCRGRYQLIQQATKAFHDVTPQALLVAALEGVGTALGIGTIGCIRGEDQKAYRPEFERQFRAAYDTFFTNLGVERNEAGFFVAPIPLAGKPLHEIKRGHKLRTREKRAFKSHIAQIVTQALDEIRRDEHGMDRDMGMVAVTETLVSS